jgi:predicted Zn-dependent peptidase
MAFMKMPKYQVSLLPNGLKLATAEMPHMASVSLGLWVGVGGRYEPADLNGASHFIEHMLFKGTRKRSARAISQDVEGIGGYLNAFTSEENTCFYSRARHDRFDELLEVLADMFANSTFDPVEIEKERGVIKEELAMYRDQPAHHVQELLNETLWPGQPLGRSLTGTNRTLNAMSRADLLHFKRSNYVTGSIVVAAAGNLTHQRVLKSVARFSRGFTRGSRPRFAPSDNSQSAPRIRTFRRRTQQTQLALGIRTCSRHDDRRFALRLLNTILGENMSSRLFQVVREDRGLAYNIFSVLSFFHDTGDLVISAGLDTENVAEVLRLIVVELRRMRRSAPDRGEFQRARDYIIGQFDLGLESSENQMMWLGEQVIGYGRIMLPTAIRRRLSAVTPSAVRDVARDFLRSDRLNIALVSPVKEEMKLRRLLRV